MTNEFEVLKDFYLLRRRYMNSQGTDNLFSLSSEERKLLENIEQALNELKQIKESNTNEALIFYIDQMIKRNNKFIAKDKGVPQLYINDNEILKQIKQILLNKSKKEELLDELLETKIRPCFMLNGDKLYKIDEGLIVPDDKMYSLLEEVYKEDNKE